MKKISTTENRPSTRTRIAAVTAVAALGLAGCGMEQSPAQPDHFTQHVQTIGTGIMTLSEVSRPEVSSFGPEKNGSGVTVKTEQGRSTTMKEWLQTSNDTVPTVVLEQSLNTAKVDPNSFGITMTPLVDGSTKIECGRPGDQLLIVDGDTVTQTANGHATQLSSDPARAGAVRQRLIDIADTLVTNAMLLAPGQTIPAITNPCAPLA